MGSQTGPVAQIGAAMAATMATAAAMVALLPGMAAAQALYCHSEAGGSALFLTYAADQSPLLDWQGMRIPVALLLDGDEAIYQASLADGRIVTFAYTPAQRRFGAVLMDGAALVLSDHGHCEDQR
ncbi:MAG: hypothetical protein Q4G25_05790 [Paracoccus sp. (in: a-proteobacteria)]|nr:hypothetical protein [Paracoccus sp. (in: a-proteobacteria)]